MWIISNDRRILVHLTGTLNVGTVKVATQKECYVVMHDDTELGAFKNMGEATDIIVKVAELLDSGARENLVWEMPENTYDNIQKSLPMDLFDSNDF